MKNVILCLTLTIIFLLGAGCATTCQSVAIPDQNKKIENPEMGRIYVVRPTSFGGSISMRITDNGEYVGNTGPNGYLCWERQPGSAEITGKAENLSTVNLEVEPAKTYYICQHIGMGVWYARNTLEVIPEEKGQKFLKKCKPPVFGK
jgi:hypothetical protein